MTKALFTSGILKTMDELLEKLIREVQQHHPQSQERQLALSELVEYILRSRSICRPVTSQHLSAVHQEIYQQLRQQLLDHLPQELRQYNSTRTSAREWVKTLLKQAFNQVLNDAQLKKLALATQQLPPNSDRRRHALGELIEAIRLSGRLCRPHREKFSPDFYELLYEEAVIETLSYVCQKIDKYDPERGQKKFMSWVNFRLDKLVIECRRKFSHLNVKELPSLNDLETIEQPRRSPYLSEMVRECIEEDRDNLFRQAHIRNQPQANFRALALARFSGKTWEEIASESGIVVPTLSSFYQRCLQKFAPKLKQYLQS